MCLSECDLRRDSIRAFIVSNVRLKAHRLRHSPPLPTLDSCKSFLVLSLHLRPTDTKPALNLHRKRGSPCSPALAGVVARKPERPGIGSALLAVSRASPLATPFVSAGWPDPSCR